MVQPTDLEKKNLETHVELCAERYKFLEVKLETVETKVSGLEKCLHEIRDMIQEMSAKRNDQIVNWGLGIIGTMTAVIAWLVVTYVAK